MLISIIWRIKFGTIKFERACIVNIVLTHFCDLWSLRCMHFFILYFQYKSNYGILLRWLNIFPKQLPSIATKISKFMIGAWWQCWNHENSLIDCWVPENMHLISTFKKCSTSGLMAFSSGFISIASVRRLMMTIVCGALRVWIYGSCALKGNGSDPFLKESLWNVHHWKMQQSKELRAFI